jgi:hypothetical protein
VDDFDILKCMLASPSVVSPPPSAASEIWIFVASVVLNTVVTIVVFAFKSPRIKVKVN